MGQLPRRVRRGRHGKLVDVLDHQLRIGDEDSGRSAAEISEQVLKAYRERGLEPPEHLDKPPDIRPEYFVFWEAYQDLMSERRTPRGMIPIGAIVEYARNFGLNVDQLKRIVWEVDKVLMKHWTGKDEFDKQEREREREATREEGAKK